MKKIRSKKSNFKNKLVDLINDVKSNPMGVVLDILKRIKLYITTNVFFCLFVFVLIFKIAVCRRNLKYNRA